LVWSTEKQTMDALIDMTTQFIEQRTRYRKRWFPFRVLSAPTPACAQVNLETWVLAQDSDAEFHPAFLTIVTNHCPGTWMDVLRADHKN